LFFLALAIFSPKIFRFIFALAIMTTKT